MKLQPSHFIISGICVSCVCLGWLYVSYIYSRSLEILRYNPQKTSQKILLSHDTTLSFLSTFPTALIFYLFVSWRSHLSQTHWQGSFRASSFSLLSCCLPQGTDQGLSRDNSSTFSLTALMPDLTAVAGESLSVLGEFLLGSDTNYSPCHKMGRFSLLQGSPCHRMGSLKFHKPRNLFLPQAISK